MFNIYHEVSRENLARCVETLKFFYGEEQDLAARIREDNFIKVSSIYHGNKDFSEVQFSAESLTELPQPNVFCGWMIAYLTANLPYIGEFPNLAYFAKEKNFPNVIRV